jgi:hypothetical protein
MRRAVDLVVDYYSYFSIEELATAFDLAAAGRLEVNLALYGGSFNVVYLSDILKAYKNHRIEVRIEIEKRRTAAEAEQKRKATAAALAAKAYESNLERLAAAIEAMKEGEEANVLAYQYDILDNAGRLTFTNEQKREAMKAAEAALKAELNSQKAAERDIFKQIALRTSIASLSDSGAIISRAKVILLIGLLDSYAKLGSVNVFKTNFAK